MVFLGDVLPQPSRSNILGAPAIIIADWDRLLKVYVAIAREAGLSEVTFEPPIAWSNARKPQRSSSNRASPLIRYKRAAGRLNFLGRPYPKFAPMVR